MEKIQPNYLLIYPNIWRALLDATEGKAGIWDQLHQVRTIGETVTDELRDRTRTKANAELVDLYSAEELGTIALQCPHSGLYHVMAEGLIVEILNPEGKHCQPGETGRVVVTDLKNLATPLLRYEVGDYAEVGHLCNCGRGLPTLKRILGREHGMVKLPDGSKHWPTTGIRDFPSDAAVRQCQLVQRSLQTMEVRLVVSNGNLNAAQEAALSKVIQHRMGYDFDCRFIYFKEQIPRSKSGKFEEFICEI
jgi:phenylacetate-CoA ligase